MSSIHTSISREPAETLIGEFLFNLAGLLAVGLFCGAMFAGLLVASSAAGAADTSAKDFFALSAHKIDQAMGLDAADDKISEECFLNYATAILTGLKQSDSVLYDLKRGPLYVTAREAIGGIDNITVSIWSKLGCGSPAVEFTMVGEPTDWSRNDMWHVLANVFAPPISDVNYLTVSEVNDMVRACLETRPNSSTDGTRRGHGQIGQHLFLVGCNTSVNSEGAMETYFRFMDNK